MASKFVWYELMTSNAFAAESFYRNIVGWSARDAEMPDFHYTLLSVGDTPVAGMMQFPQQPAEGEGGPGWLGHVGVGDVDAAAAQAQALGAKVLHPPTDIPNDVGRFAVLADPQGACFGLFKPNGDRETPAPMTPGAIGWHELHTNDAEKALTFYGLLFDWKQIQAMDMGPIGKYHIFGDENAPMGFGGIFNDRDAAPPHWLYYFAVADIDAAVARVSAAGGTIVREPTQVPGGAWIIQASDPQGGAFALVGMRTAQAG